MASHEFSIDPSLLDLRSKGGLAGDLPAEVVDQVRAAVDSLPPLQRAVIEALFWERLDLDGGVSKLAREHDVSRWFIYQALEQGLESLRSSLGPLREAYPVG